MAYSAKTDLLLGNIPEPANAQRYVDDAGDEIDSKIGFRYATPISLSENIPAQRPGALLLKRINQWLSTGRLLLALDAAGEDDQLHQYGEYLVREATAALDSIADGSITLPGAVPVDPDVPKSTGPVAAYGDDYSLVDGYYSVFGNPAQVALETPAYGPYGYRGI